MQGQVVGAYGAGDNVRVAGQELGRRVDDTSAPKLERRVQKGVANVLSTTSRGPGGARRLGDRRDIHEPKLAGLDSVSP